MDKKRKCKFILIIILLIIFCTTVGAVSAVYLTGSSLKAATVNSSAIDTPQLDDNGGAIDGMAESKSSEQVMEELQKAQINVTDKLSSCIVFPNGEAGTSGNWTVENLASNNVIMQCEVYLGDELIARSASIHPNQHIDSVSLLEHVASGTYDVTAYVNYYALDSSKYISKAGYQIKLTVQ